MVLSQGRITRLIPIVLCALALFSILIWQRYHQVPLSEKPIVAVITSYNNAKWVYKNLDSIFAQDYKNFRIVYCDDCSNDGTADLVERYIQEKNVADKITLIRNKKRAIKLLNLYTIHHSLDDWDIIAQIDGDDWLFGKDVFKEINKAYHNGCWLAYTQFECSNGEPGSNKLPPYWVRKNGTFREYKPSWFMYSHLKTFYAWLFKQVKLDDFIDDQAGTFPNVNDDVLMMYPMLEMARNHFTFIPKTCYIWNVSPGFRLMPESAPITQPQKVFLKKSPYNELSQPVINKLASLEQVQADCIMMCTHKTYQHTERALQSIYKNITNLGTVYVVYSELNKQLEDIMKKYTQIRFVNSDHVQTLLKSLDREYVILADDKHEVINTISLSFCIKEMEKTFAHAFHLEPAISTLQVMQKKNIASQVLPSAIYAYKYGAEKNIQTEVHNGSWTIYRKNDALAFFNTLSLQERETKWQMPSFETTKIGLMFDKTPLKKAA